MNVRPTLHVELVPLADLPPDPMLWCPTCSQQQDGPDLFEEES